MDPVQRFAAAATDFERWIVDGTDQGPDAASEALIQLLRLYAYGLELPEAWSDDLADGGDVERLARHRSNGLPSDSNWVEANMTRNP
jgi:hypothetical protein